MEKDYAADGLRGIAALNVVVAHFVVAFFPLGLVYLHPGLATAQAQPSIVDNILSLPLISIFWNGHFAVCVFFVLSGYVLTKSFIATGDLNILRLRAARRYLRLMVPVLASVLLAYIVLSLGADAWKRAAQNSHSLWLANYWLFEPSLYDAVKEGVIGAIFLGDSTYMPPLWTMRIEFIGSMLVFAYRALCFDDKQALFSLPTLLIALFLFFPHEWMYYAGFIAGSYIGEAKPATNRIVVGFFVALGVIFGAFDYSSIYEWTRVVPLADADRKSFFNILGGICLLYAVRSGALNRLLLSRVIQFVGRISYSIYLVHFAVLFTFSSWCYTFLQEEMGVHVVVSTIINLAVSMAITLLLAIVFDRLFDRNGVALSRWVFPGCNRRGSVARPLARSAG